jgi:O-antigen ligase
MVALFLGCFGPLLNVLFNFQSGTTEEQTVRYTAVAVNENVMALEMVLSIAIAFYFASNPATMLWHVRPVLWAYMVVAAFGALITGSRGGVACLAVLVVVTLVMLRRVNWKVALLFLVASGTAYQVGAKLVPEEILTRIAEGTEGHSFLVRLELWKAGIAGWLESPLLGHGFLSFADVAARHGALHLGAHNTWISVLVDEGTIGASLFVLTWVLAVWRVWRMPRLEQMLCVSLVASYFPITISGSQEYHKVLWIIFGLLLGMSEATRSLPPSPAALPALSYQRPRLGSA